MNIYFHPPFSHSPKQHYWTQTTGILEAVEMNQQLRALATLAE